MKIFIPFVASLVFALYLPCYAVAEDVSFDIKSAKTAMVDEGVLYVSAGYPKNYLGFETQLADLWNKAGKDFRTDSYQQSWRKVTITDLEAIYGSVDKNYLAIYQNDIYPHKAVGAYLMRWACGGPVVPLLELGKHKFGKMIWEWGVLALGVTSLYEKFDKKAADKALIPRDFYGPLRAPSGIELWVNGIKRYSYIQRNEDHNVAPQNILIDHKSGKRRVIVQKSPMDERC